jgi:hypothetical protein
MENQNHSRSVTSEERRKNLARSADVLSRFFRKWAVIFPNHPTGGQAVAHYLEALSDLSPDQIESGCAEAIKTAEQFPKPGHIRAAVPVVHGVFLGLPQLSYPEISKEEREEALKYSAALRAALAKSPRSRPQKRRPLTLPASQFTIEQQREVLKRKGYL